MEVKEKATFNLYTCAVSSVKRLTTLSKTFETKLCIKELLVILDRFPIVSGRMQLR